MKKASLWMICGGLVLYLVLFSFQQINLPTADIGRYLMSGSIFLHQLSSWHTLLHTNFYSFTNTAFPTVNHHWGSGIIFYLLYLLGGFSGLSLVYFICIALTVILLILAIRDDARPFDILLAGLFLIPLIASRQEVRPEGFSYVFIALFLYILYRYTRGKLSYRALIVLPLIELFWANLHIYFIFGIFLVGVFFFEAILSRHREQIKQLGIATGATALAACFNPFGPALLIYPFTIFKNYGYRVVENQSIWFLEHLPFVSPDFLWFKLAAGAVILGTIFIIARRQHFWQRIFNREKNFSLALLIITITFGILGYTGIRSIPLFAIAALPLLALELTTLRRRYTAHIRIRNDDTKLALFGLVVLAVAFFACVHYSSRLPWNHSFGLGLVPGSASSLAFFKETGIHGPIFNNYDSGGMLIWGLYPQEKVFVDNRPEAYPASFFTDTYVPMQEDDSVWNKELQKDQFNAIYFYRLDMTPWAQEFLLHRINDPEWAPVYVDAETIIFLRRNAENASIIQKYELPKSMFTMASSTAP